MRLLLLIVMCIAPLAAESLFRAETLADGSAAAAFALNWRFFANATDYYARDAESSPLLLFWSLAVIVQVYVAHALVYTLLARLGPRVGLGLEQRHLELQREVGIGGDSPLDAGGIRGAENVAGDARDLRHDGAGLVAHQPASDGRREAEQQGDERHQAFLS